MLPKGGSCRTSSIVERVRSGCAALEAGRCRQIGCTIHIEVAPDIVYGTRLWKVFCLCGKTDGNRVLQSTSFQAARHNGSPMVGQLFGMGLCRFGGSAIDCHRTRHCGSRGENEGLASLARSPHTTSVPGRLAERTELMSSRLFPSARRRRFCNSPFLAITV